MISATVSETFGIDRKCFLDRAIKFRVQKKHRE